MSRPKNCRKCHKPKSQCKCGRKPFDGKDINTILLKLEQAFSVGASDEEACFYADISESMFYNYLKKNPEFKERKAQLKKKPVLLARQSVVKSIQDNVETAKWYLVKKVPKEFGDQQEIVHRVINFSEEAEKRAKKYE